MSSLKHQELVFRFEGLVAAYGPALMRLIASYESVAQTREDLLQEILLAVWTALPRFRGDSSERTFVFRIAHNKCLTHVWRRGTRAEVEADLPEVTDPHSNPEAQAIQNHRRGLLMDAIRSLPLNYRQVLTLALEDLSPPEIAAVLGISENNAAVRLNRARKALRLILEGQQ
jgi:RNA polymerase sigma factor (sigma-70 family)